MWSTSVARSVHLAPLEKWPWQIKPARFKTSARICFQFAGSRDTRSEFCQPGILGLLLVETPYLGKVARSGGEVTASNGTALGKGSRISEGRRQQSTPVAIFNLARLVRLPL